MLSSICRRQKTLDGLNNYHVERKFLDGSRICREAIKTNSRKLRWIENVLRSVEKSSPRVSIDSYLLRSCRDGVFQRREKHRNECNQACYPTKDSTNIFKLPKTSLQQEKYQAFRSKTHTHTH